MARLDFVMDNEVASGRSRRQRRSPDAPYLQASTAAIEAEVEGVAHHHSRLTRPQVMHLRNALRFSRDSPRKSTDDDLHPAILWLAHAWTGRHQEVRVAEALDGDRILRHAVRNQLRLDCLRSTNR